jgi:hypothetical protein
VFPATVIFLFDAVGFCFRGSRLEFTNLLWIRIISMFYLRKMVTFYGHVKAPGASSVHVLQDHLDGFFLHGLS